MIGTSSFCKRFLTISCRGRRRARNALTVIEVSVSTLLVGLLLVASLKTVGSATSGQFANGQRIQAYLLARALTAEILELPYEDPDDSPTLGPEPGEDSGGTRADFDDVDDYAGWSASPPVRKDDTPLPNMNAWQRTATVEYVDPDDLTRVVGIDLGAKRITVTVSRDGSVLSSVMVIVTESLASSL